MLTTIVTSATLATLFFVLQACSPTLNWRDARFEDKEGNPMNEARPLQTLLPCKPDRATREQTLSGMTVELSLMGCVAGDATFTIGRIPLKNASAALQVLSAWQAATWTNMGDGSANAPVAQAIKIAGASSAPPAVKMDMTGRAAFAQTAWFVQQEGAQMVLYQAMMISPSKQAADASSQTEAAITFFEGLKF